MTPITSYAIEHAQLAVTAATGGDIDVARQHLSRAQHHARSTARRERQLVEIATLIVACDAERAAGLSLEHTAEYPDDAHLLATLRE
jgi:hypothetical protein